MAGGSRWPQQGARETSHAENAHDRRGAGRRRVGRAGVRSHRGGPGARSGSRLGTGLPASAGRPRPRAGDGRRRPLRRPARRALAVAAAGGVRGHDDRRWAPRLYRRACADGRARHRPLGRGDGSRHCSWTAPADRGSHHPGRGLALRWGLPWTGWARSLRRSSGARRASPARWRASRSWPADARPRLRRGAPAQPRATLAMRTGTPNLRWHTEASAAMPSRMAACEGLAKHSRIRLLP